MKIRGWMPGILAVILLAGCGTAAEEVQKESKETQQVEILL
jgi:uncharacterized lipoprotein